MRLQNSLNHNKYFLICQLAGSSYNIPCVTYRQICIGYVVLSTQWGDDESTQSHDLVFFLVLHLYSATSKPVLRRGGPKQDPTLGGVSTEGIWS